MQADDTITYSQALEALGYVAGQLAARADAWNGNAPEWFPEPSEWLTLLEEGLRGADRPDILRAC